MSAFIVSREHIRYLVWARYNAAVKGRDLVPGMEEMESDAVMLYNANIQSVNYRYEEDRPLESDFNIGGPRSTETAQVLMAIHCLEYQACEPPDWEQSPAYHWLRDLGETYERLVPGYDDAQWEISEAPEPNPVTRLV